MRTFSNTSHISATTSQCSSLPFSVSKTKFRSHLKTLTFFPARTDHIDLYPNNDLNHTLHAGEYIRSVLLLQAPYKFQFYFTFLTYSTTVITVSCVFFTALTPNTWSNRTIRLTNKSPPRRLAHSLDDLPSSHFSP